MATANSALSFQGLSTGLQTDALVNAILAQESKTLDGLTARQTANQKKTAALGSMRTAMNTLSISLASLQDKLNSRIVTSTDPNGVNVTATASGAASGSYDLTVTAVATKGRISSTMLGGVPQNLAVDNPADAILQAGEPKATFAIQGTDGVIKTFDVTDNSLNGLKNAINASGAGVTATIINTGVASKAYQLVITANDTGTGTTGGKVSLVDLTHQSGAAAGAEATSLGIAAGTVDNLATPTALTGGLTSDVSGASAKDADFTLNGIRLIRKSNVVSDAAAGVTFTLKQGNQTGVTTLTVAQDKTTAAAGIQDVITKYNALLTGYKTASTSTQDPNGTILPAALTGDATSRSMMSQIRSALGGMSAGLPGSATFQNLAALGVRTNQDGTLSLDNTTFQAAMEKDPAAAMKLFTFSGSSNNGILSFQSGTDQTATGSLDFTITKDMAGVYTAVFTGTPNGPVTLTSSDGNFVAGPGDLNGLTFTATGTGTGTLTLSRGAGQAVRDLVTSYSATGTGALYTALNNIQSQNKTLGDQIDSAQAALDRRKVVLQAQFSKMEVAVAQMKASAGSLSSA
jgi:flagellar hook-associated protein 2